MKLGRRPVFRAMVAKGLLAFAAAAGAEDARATGLEVVPAQIELTSFSRQQQVAVAVALADGSLRDVTAEARFEVIPKEIASGDGGLVRARRDGTATLAVYVDGRTASIPIVARGVERAEAVSYRLDVVPILSKAGCNQGTCHGNLTGKGGFRLSLRGDDPAFDLTMIVRDALGRRVDRQRPASSLLLAKPTGKTPHEGGKRFTANSYEAQKLQQWIADGATDDVERAPALVRLEVFPNERVLAPGATRQQLVVTAHFADGTRRDVTSVAAYDVNDPEKITVSATGMVRTRQAIEGAVSVRYGTGRATSRLTFVVNRPSFVWSQPPADHAIDRLVFEKLHKLRVHPSELADDSTFLRRAYLVTVGRLPTVAETRAFLHDRDPAKRRRLAERLVQLPEFADFWALKWADVLRNEEKNMGVEGAKRFQRWLVEQMRADVPLSELARKLVTSTGSTWENPPASFHRTSRDPMAAAEALGQVFLGYRLQCARCHNHPFDVWTQHHYYSLAAYFANIDRKQIDNKRRDKLDQHEINGDEIIFVKGVAELPHPTRPGKVFPRPLTGGKAFDANRPALDQLGDWLTAEPQLARNLANRIWFHLMGRGVVDPPDDFRDSNPPVNEALLRQLTAEFTANGMRLRPLVVSILSSRTFQLSSVPNETNADQAANFARYSDRLLTGEVILDAVAEVLEARRPLGTGTGVDRAVQLAGANMGGRFLKVFGRPDRLLTCECERSDQATLAQAFQMLNGAEVRVRLEASDNRLGRLLKEGKTNQQIVEELYLAALCRRPSAAEQKAMVRYLEGATGVAERRQALEDVAWALLSSPTFLVLY